jgi:hypothetical protein
LSLRQPLPLSARSPPKSGTAPSDVVGQERHFALPKIILQKYRNTSLLPTKYIVHFQVNLIFAGIICFTQRRWQHHI